MYTEEPRRNIDWGSVIKKGLIIIIAAAIIFLVIWLVTRNNDNNEINVDYNGNSNNKEVLNNDTKTYSEIFIDNYRYFHDTAKEYFLISNLPKEGETIKFTLQQLIDKKLVLPFGYTDNKSCDTEASYVTVKNLDGKYTMTTTLVCGTEVATTNEELGCNQICVDKVCECICDNNKEVEKVTEYQYKQAYKATETVYSCPSGYTKVGSGSKTSCIKTDNITSKASKVVTYSCPSGFTKEGSGENTICKKGTDSSIKATKTTTYSCPSGYTKSGSGDNTICTKGKETTIDATVTYDYSCPSGYTMSGSGDKTTCSKESSTKTIAKTTYTYSCPSGYTKSGSGANTKCIKETTSLVSAKANTTYKCSSGTLTSDNRCRITGSATTIAATSNISYSCPSGYTQYGSSCIKYLYTPVSYGSSYKGCPGGQLVKSNCSSGNCLSSNYVYKCSKGLSSVTNYSCPSGYTMSGSGENTICTKAGTTTYRSATPTTTYTCSTGTLTKDNKCSITDKTTKSATRNKEYYCTKGTLNGLYCYEDDTELTEVIKTPVYSCDAGYTKIGSGINTTCKITGEDKVKATKTTTYSCPSGYTKSGNDDNTICKISSEKTKAYKVVNYNCDTGYKKIGVGSEAICTKGSTTTKSPSKSTKEVTKYKYQWSTKTNINGWEKTGQTRESVVIDKETSSK